MIRIITKWHLSLPRKKKSAHSFLSYPAYKQTNWLTLPKNHVLGVIMIMIQTMIMVIKRIMKLIMMILIMITVINQCHNSNNVKIIIINICIITALAFTFSPWMMWMQCSWGIWSVMDTISPSYPLSTSLRSLCRPLAEATRHMASVEIITFALLIHNPFLRPFLGLVLLHQEWYILDVFLFCFVFSVFIL